MNTIRCVFVGNSGVGKTTFLNRAADKHHLVLPTIGVDNVFFRFKGIQYQCWDTSGAEKFKVLAQIFIKNTKHCVYMYDAARHETFEECNIPPGALIVANVQHFNGSLPENHIGVDVGADESIYHVLDILRLREGVSPVEITQSPVTQSPESPQTCCCWGI